jgi:hypothetical protein
MHTKNKYSSKWSKFSYTCYMFQNYHMDAVYTPRTIMILDLCNYKEKQAFFKNKYLW